MTAPPADVETALQPRLLTQRADQHEDVTVAECPDRLRSGAENVTAAVDAARRDEALAKVMSHGHRGTTDNRAMDVEIVDYHS